jgi:GT2 family glycosyltransferase
MKVSIGVKALNEEQHIDACLASALQALGSHEGEVILADSGSTDRTVEIARRRAVKIVTFSNLAERCCGAGAQLAFQHAAGEFFWLVDGDMVLNPEFLEAALARLAADPTLAGVGGMVRERHVEAMEFQISAQAKRRWKPGLVDRLDGGGVYRAAAIRELGYFSDRNLHAFEEFDLGARLQSRGWRLLRLEMTAVEHFGHRDEGYRLLWRRIRARYPRGTGEVLRAALGEPHLAIVLTRFGYLRNAVAVLVWWAALAVLVGLALVRPGPSLTLLAAMIGAPVLLLGLRRRSLKLGVYSFAAWNVSALGLVDGLLRRRTPPHAPIDSRVLAGG